MAQGVTGGGPTVWSDEHVARLKVLFLETGKSCSEIAAVFNKEGATFSRNSIIGKLTRLGLTAGHRLTPAKPLTRQPGPNGPGRKVGQKPARPAAIGRRAAQESEDESMAARRAPKAIPTGALVTVVTREGPRLRCEDLEPGMCKWPIGDPLKDDFTFCGRPALRSAADLATNYCRGHSTAAVNPGANRDQLERLANVA